MYKFSKFLLSMFKIGCIGFGGGSALIPVIEREFIGDKKLDTKENFDRDILIASLTPGALPVELASSLGWRNFGWKGMVFGSVCMALPGVSATLLLLTCLTQFRSQIGRILGMLTIAVSLFIIWQIMRYIRKVCGQCREISTKFFHRAIIVMIGVFALSCGKYLYQLIGIEGKPPVTLSTFHILSVAFVSIIGINIVRGIHHSHSTHNHADSSYVSGAGSIKDLLVWIAFLLILVIPGLIMGNCNSPVSYLSFLARGGISVLLSFGGGDAYLAVADGLFVESAMISSSTFYGDVVAVANILPGSILCKALTAIGYYYGISITGSILGGLTFALGGFACSVALSCMVFGMIYHLYERFSNFRSMKTISHYIGPIICGLLGTVILALLVSIRNLW